MAVANRLKDPGFNVDSESDITSVVTLAQRWSSQMDQRSQMQATIRNVVTAPELRDFISCYSKRREFYETKAWRELADKPVRIRDESVDLREDVAVRLYQIRCRIVHAKVDERNLKPLYPSSADIYKLEHDLAMMRWLAERSLIAFSEPIGSFKKEESYWVR